MVWITHGTTCRRYHSWIGIPGRPPYVIPRGLAGLKKKKLSLERDVTQLAAIAHTFLAILAENTRPKKSQDPLISM